MQTANKNENEIYTTHTHATSIENGTMHTRTPGIAAYAEIVHTVTHTISANAHAIFRCECVETNRTGINYWMYSKHTHT